jgi:alpha-glucosidase
VKNGEGLFLCFHEAALYDYPSYTLYSPDCNTLALDLVPWKNGIKAYVKTPLSLPGGQSWWLKNQQTSLQNYTILNLNDSCKIDDVSWIKLQIHWYMVGNAYR